MKVKVPKQIKIGALSATVGIKEHIRNDDGFQGCYNQRTEELSIDAAQSGSQRDRTFLHEIVHLIALNHELNLPEADISRLGNGLLEFFQALGVDFDWSNIE